MSWFSRMSRRGRTVAIGTAATLILLAIAVFLPLPYVALGPGVTVNTLGSSNGAPVISVSGADVPASVGEVAAEQQEPGAGHLNMTTISVNDGLPLLEALSLWTSGRYALVPREEVYPPDRTVEQVNEQNAAQFTASVSAAEIAALRYLRYPEAVFVSTVPEDSPSAGILTPGERIVAVDGRDITDGASLRDALAGTSPGQQVRVSVEPPEAAGTDAAHGDAPGTDGADGGQDAQLPTAPPEDPAVEDVTVTLGSQPDRGPQGWLGIEMVQLPVAPFTIDIPLENIGGPSAGLMFALGIIDTLTPGDLTDGRFIAGTGTMQVSGTDTSVGPIGGVLLKMIAAREAGATVFLVPEANCAEALTQIPAGLQLVKVGSLDQAMTALDDLRQGRAPMGC